MRFLVPVLFASVLAAQEFPNVTVETVVKDAHYAEGPVWSLEGFLLFSDTALRTRLPRKRTPGKGLSDYASRPGGANGNTYDQDGRLYTCEFRERRVTRTAKNGKVDVLASRFEGKRLNAPNDIVVRRDGNGVRLHRSSVRRSAGHQGIGFLRRVYRNRKTNGDAGSRGAVEDPAQRNRAYLAETDACCTWRIRMLA